MPWQFAAAQTLPLSPCSLTDIDKDNDGLIDICDLEGLNVIRYQLDGTGYKANESAEKITAGCPGNRCRGYELMRGLDFLDANSYRSGVIRTDWVVGSGWLPIGSVVAPFGSGNIVQDSTFEGNGYAIRNLTINRPNSDNVGLFAVNGVGGEIKDIRLLDVNIQGKSRVGALVARNEPGKIRNSYVSGSIRGVSRIGALVGYNSFTSLASPVLENSSATGVVIGTGDKVGGLVGSTYSTIKNSQAFNTVSGVAEVGGLVGTTAETFFRTGQIINSRAVGNVTGAISVGGLIGRVGTALDSFSDRAWRIVNSHATGTVEGEYWVGGLVGNADIIHIENSSAHGEVVATGIAIGVGGLVGLINEKGGRIDKSHATGSVTGIRRVGGFLGGAIGAIDFDDSYATGSVTGIRRVGGFIGHALGGSITNSYAIGMVQVRQRSENIGGFIGQSGGTRIMNSYAIGNVQGGQGGSRVGGFIGSTDDVNIINGYATGRVQGGEESRGVGGFIGISLVGSIRNSHAIGNVEGDIVTGGFIGQSEGTRIINSYAASHVGGRGTVGGFIGFSSAVITDSYATGSVAAVQTVGGFIGVAEGGSITNSYAASHVRGGETVGGFVGFSSAVITNSHATGNVTAGNDGGGFVGFHDTDGSITNSYATGNVVAESGAGGFVGFHLSVITNSYATGNVVAERDAGGFNAAGSGVITHSYWDRQTSGRASSVGGRGKTTSELQLPTTSTGIYSSWDDDVWDFGTSEQYPALKYSDGTLQPNQRLGLLRLGLPSSLILSPFFKPEVLSYRVIDETDIRQIRLTPAAANFDTDIIIESSGGFRERMPSGTTSSEISLNTVGVTTATVEVLTSHDVLIRYTLAFNDRTFNEGERIILKRTTARDVDESTLRYKWTQVSGMLRLLPVEGISQAVLDVPIPELSLSKTEDDREITIRLEINDGTKTETKDLRLTIAKADNGTAVQSDPIITRSDRTLTAPEVDLSTDPDGSGTINSYLWQRRADINADWIDIEGVTGNMYRVPEDTAYAEYRVQYAYTDGQGYVQVLISEVFIFITDVDIDNNGLIEINDLEGLDAIRYQLDGSGYRQNETADKITTGCPDAGCKGYELKRSLDFERSTSYRSGIIGTAWTTGSGWLPIGTSKAPFDATFNAKGHTIANLRIDRSSAARGVGLFGITASNAEIANVGLLDVNISGNQGVGGLVGYKQGGSIIGSYVTGQVRGSGTYDVGGLVGWHRGGTISDSYSSSTVVGLRRNVGGLVGDNDGGTISDSYAKGNVNGEEEVGGLVGRNNNTGIIMRSRAEVKVDGGGRVGGLAGENSGIITNSYTGERIIGRADVGGLAGWNSGAITNSYALGFVKGDNGVGGFVGNNLQGTITNSYARGNVDGANRYIGGLVGWSARGAIINSYAQGNVRGKDGVGGLVGVNLGLANNSGVGRVTKSYATGRVRGDANSGGLIGENRDGHVEKSYWNKTNNPTVVSAGGISRTSVEMQIPTQPGNSVTEIYYDWSTADWDFSATDQYPTLEYAVGLDQSQPACGTAEDPDCGTPLTGQLQIVRTAPIEPISDIRLLTETVKDLNVVLSVGIGDDPTQFKTGVKSSNDNIATASIAEGGGLVRTLRVFTGSDIGRSEITVSVDDGEGSADSVSSTTFVVTTETNDAPKITITSLSELISVDDRIVISVEVMDDNFDAGDRVLLTSSVVSEVLVEPRQIAGISSNKTERITLKGVRGGTAMVRFTVIDSKGAADSETVSVRVDAKPTGSVRIEPDSSNKWLLGSTSTIEDANGIAEVDYRWYRNGVVIANATNRNYMIADNREGRATGTSYRLELTVIDSIGQSVVIQSNSLRVANERPVIISTTATKMIGEGDTQNISVSASDPNYDNLMYRWSEDSGILSNEHSNPAILGIPPDYIKDAASTRTTVNLEVRVSDGELATTGTVSVVVNKQNNGSATLGNLIEIGSRETTLAVMVLSDDPDNGVSGAVGYQWQVCEGNEGRCPSESNWMNINDAGGTQYIISDSSILLEDGSTLPLVVGDSLFRVEGTYTDGQGYSEVVYSQGYSYSGRVNASPTISGLPLQRIRLFEGTETTLNVTINDADADDISGNLVFGVQSDIPEVARVDVAGAGTTRTIKITAIGAGIATITATVNDDRGVSNSKVSERFEVEVEGNEAPMLEVIAAPEQTTGLGNTTQVVVLVSDTNFDVGDRVVLEAMSSSRSRVSVLPTQTDTITTDTMITFMLTAEQSGEATITFTATDSKNVSTDTEVMVRVNTPPQVLSDDVPSRVVATVGEAFELKTSEFFADADDDVLRYSAVGLPQSIVITTTGTLVGVPLIGDASKNGTGLMVTVSVDDGIGGSTRTTFTLLIDAKPSGSLRVNPDDQWLLTAMVEDANGIVEVNYRWYRNGVAIASATSPTYTIPDNRAGRAAGTNYSLELTVIDSIEQSVVIQSNSYMIANERPIITSITVAEMINEGDTQDISVIARDPNYDDLMYRWSEDSGVLSNDNSNPTTLGIPPDYIQDAVSSRTTVNLEVRVSDGELATTGTVSVVVNKRNNGSARLGTSIEIVSAGTTLTTMVLSDDPDNGMSGAVAYQWQVCAGNEAGCPSANDWLDIDDATGTQYMILGSSISVEGGDLFLLVEGRSLFRVEGAYTDGQGYREEVYSQGYSYSKRVNASPTINGLPVQRIRLLEGTKTEFEVELNDPDADDISSDLVFGIQSDIPEVARVDVEGAGTTRTIKITAIGVGITTITATVNDGRGMSNSEVSERFEVEVEGNEAPMLEVIVFPQQILGLGNTTQVMVLISDINFDVGDRVVLEAMSSSRSIVSVIPTRTDPIATDMSVPFTLSGIKAGTATIVFTATDRSVSTDSVSLLVSVDAKPTGGVRVDPDDQWLLTAIVEDANGIVEVNYQWYREGVAIAGATSPTYTIADNREGRAAGTSYSLEMTVIDSLGQSVVIRSNSYTVANERPIITVPVAKMISEGDTQDISVTASDPNYDDLMYLWIGDSGVLSNENSNPARLSIPPYYIRDAVSTQTILNLEVGVSDGELFTTRTVLVVVNKKNNGSARLGLSLDEINGDTAIMTTVSSDDPDGGTGEAVAYQWQVCEGNGFFCPSENDWLDIEGATEAQYIISGSSILLEGGSRFQIVKDSSVFRAEATYTDGQGYSETIDAPRYTHRERVNNSPKISGIPLQRIRLFKGTETKFVVVLSDADTDDISSDLIFGIQSDEPEVVSVSVEGAGTTRTIKITAIGVGIATVTATVNDGRGVSNSEVSKQFEVEVEGNEAPMLEIIIAPQLAIKPGNTTQVVVLVSDTNFDIGDRVVLEAMSSSRSIVSVVPTQTDTITTDTSITFTLTGVKAGTAAITFIVMDGAGLRGSVALSVRVNARPNDSVSITPDDTNKWLLRSTSTIADASDIVGVNYRWYRNSIAITDATSRTYMITDNRAGRATGTSYRLDLIIMDNLGQSVVIESNLYVIANERPVITSITAAEMIAEGDTQNISVSASDANYDDLMYRWSEDSGILSNEHSNPATLNVPPDYIKDVASTRTTLNLEVEVSDGELATTSAVLVEVRKKNNGSATIRISVEIGSRGTTSTAMILSDDPDGGTSGTMVYQWQVCEGNEGRCPSQSHWMNIDDAGGIRYMISGSSILVEDGSTFPLVEGGSLFRVEGTYTDGQGYREEVYSQGYSYSTRVNASPTISGLPAQRIRLFEGTEAEFEVELNDLDADDISSNLVFGVRSDTPEVARVDVAGAGTTRTIKITGVGAGIATITATVNDDRGVSNSKVSERFEVEVEGNEAPMLEVIAVPMQTIGLGNTTQVVVLLSDTNFDVGDRVVLEAVSSSRSRVSVLPTQTDTITTDTIITLMLTAKQSGEATITFTATDSKNVSTDTEVMVRVNTPPQVLFDNVPSRVVATVGEAFELKTSEFFADADDDVLRYSAVGLPQSIVITTTGTLVGVPLIGDASKNETGLMVTVFVDDGIGGSTRTTFTLLIDAKPSGSLRIEPDNSDKWLLRAASTIEDANGIVEVDYRWYRNGVAIAGATSQTYTIPDTRAGRTAGTSYSLEMMVVDSIGQSVIIQSNSHTIANERPVIIVSGAEMINEGDTQDISVSASDPNYDDLMYRWSEDSGVLSNDNSNPATLGIPPDYIKDAASARTTLNLEVRVSDGALFTTRTLSVVVNKRNNGSARLGTAIEIVSAGTTLTTMVLSDDPDNGINGAVAYQWQVCAGNEAGCPSANDWLDIDDATGTQYMILGSSISVEGGSAFPLVEGGSLFRAAGTYTDGQGYREAVYSQGYSYSTRVNVSPTISGLPARRIRLLEGTETEFEVVLNDADADDISSDLVFGIQSGTPEVARVDVEGAGTTRTIKITAIGVGIATITATVNDGRGVSNSEVSERFEVEVEGNEAPMLEVIAAPNRTIGLGNTTQVMVLVSDADFDVGDGVVLEAMSSSRSIVSVIPTRTDPIATDMSVPFTLSGIKAGTATIVFTATDRSVSTDSVSLLVSVDAKPTGGVRIEPDSSNQWLLRVASTVEDANGIVEVNYQWYREGVAIANATNPTYTIPDSRNGRAVGTSYSLEMTVMDSLGQSVVIRSNPYEVANEQPVITVPVAEISEGDRQDISVTASDPNYDDLVYRWIGDSGVLSNENSNPARLSIPPYYIRDAVSTQTILNLEVEVNDGELFTTRTVLVVVNKKNNDFARLGVSLDEINGDTAILATVSSDDPDGGTGEAVAYQWQVCEGNGFSCPSANDWLDIDGANEAQYIISGSSILLEGGSRFQIVKDISVFRAEATYTDGQGYRETIDTPGYTHRERVNNSPTISGIPSQRISLLEGAEAVFGVELSDADADDISSDLIFGIQSDEPEVASVSVAGAGTTRTIKITGIGAGITTVTATVNDRRGVSNSEVSKRFEVAVEGNEAPMLELIAAPQPAIRLGNTTQVMVLISDTNFDVGDGVVLAARSSSRTIVSVIPTQTDTITTDTSITFTLTGVIAGTATVVFTATDSRGSTANVSLLVRVGKKPTGRVRIEPDNSNKWLLRATSTLEDADNIVGVNYRWYREGVAITDATSRTYMIADNKLGRATGTSYRLDLIIMDNLGQSVVIQSNSYIVANERPVITSTTATEVIGEGDTQNISVSASDANYDDLMYRWSEDSGVFSNDNSNPATLDIPPDYIKDAASTRTTLNLEVEVSDGELATTSAVLVEVRKKNNGSATIRISVEIVSGGTTLTAMILSDDPDGGTSGTVVYQWQVCEGNEGRCPSESHWMNIDDAGGIRYMISGSSILVEGGNRFSVVEDGSLFRVKGTYTDGQGYREAVYSPERVYTTRPLLRIRTKVFLEGPLQ